MIVLFTANTKGGILQFTAQVLKELIKMGYEAVCFVPEGSSFVIAEKLKNRVIHYKKTKGLISFSANINEIVKRIKGLKPEAIWYMDNASFTSNVILDIGADVPQILTIHDALSHSTRNSSIIGFLKNRYRDHIESKAERISKYILLLSEESYKTYSGLYPNNAYKLLLMNLGAHIPDAEAAQPPEIKALTDPYHLFFGRIDKYKGIGNMLKAYLQIPPERRTKLVIAGNGELSAEEKQLAAEDERIILINRYIDDGEMIWLFENALALVLPYTDATQSGIIPIAYKLGVPVIVSDVPGLTQFVEHNRTGYVCKDINEMAEAMQRIANTGKAFSENVKQYYTENLDWGKNLKKMLEDGGF